MRVVFCITAKSTADVADGSWAAVPALPPARFRSANRTLRGCDGRALSCQDRRVKIGRRSWVKFGSRLTGSRLSCLNRLSTHYLLWSLHNPRQLDREGRAMAGL